jgi:hypothetical protein
MTKYWIIGAVVFGITCSARAAITRVATFENFGSGQILGQSFADPLSGITFRESTHVSQIFVVNYSSTFFGPGRFLSSGVIADGGLGAYFGFTGDLPLPANHVSIDAMYSGGGPPSQITLQGLDAVGSLVAQQTGPASGSVPFTLAINSAQLDISTIRVIASGVSSGYDNVNFTIIPEPMGAPALMLVVLLVRRIRS